MYPKSIQKVSESYLCSNCGACKTVCPQSAIEFRSTSLGRLYAQVSDKCVDCGICQRVCPSLETEEESKIFSNLMGHISSVSVGKANDKGLYSNAQSGGVCSALLKFLFDTGKIDGALVCQMDYGTPTPVVKSTIITSSSQLGSCQKSCYTPVELLSVLRENYQKYNSIAVVGVGCHIEGLMRIQKLNKIIDSKIFCKIGLICDRTLCGTIQEVFSSYVPSFKKIKISWRCKNLHDKTLHFPYKNAPIIIEDQNGKYKVLSNRYRFALKDM